MGLFYVSNLVQCVTIFSLEVVLETHFKPLSEVWTQTSFIVDLVINIDLHVAMHLVAGIVSWSLTCVSNA